MARNPSHTEVEGKLKRFLAFLEARGAQVVPTTNPWEVVRFKGKQQTSVVYCNSRDGITFTGEAGTAWNAFDKNHAWTAVPEKKKRSTNTDRKRSIYNALVQRDGPQCFFCKEETSEDDRSIEHLVPLAHGGPNHLSNFVLAHRRCNANAGHLSAMQKIRIREAA